MSERPVTSCDHCERARKLVASGQPVPNEPYGDCPCQCHDAHRMLSPMMREPCDAAHDGHDCQHPGECQRAIIAMCERMNARERDGERQRDH